MLKICVCKISKLASKLSNFKGYIIIKFCYPKICIAGWLKWALHFFKKELKAFGVLCDVLWLTLVLFSARAEIFLNEGLKMTLIFLFVTLRNGVIYNP